MIGGDHSALSYKLPAGGKVGGTLNYPLYQNKISLLHDLQTDFHTPITSSVFSNFHTGGWLPIVVCVRMRYVFVN